MQEMVREVTRALGVKFAGELDADPRESPRPVRRKEFDLFL
jgi:hypothetical protein